MNKEIKQPVMRSLARVVEWEINPRRGVYQGMPELKASLEREGLQDAIHVWVRTDADYLLKGHRRTRGMKELGWTECLQVVHSFADEREAFAFLLEDHGHTVPLDAEEKIVAIETGVKLGMTTADLAPMMGVTEERAQLWFDLGKDLPMKARTALAKGDLSVNTAELLLQIEDPTKRHDASAIILNDPQTGESMAHGQAKAFILGRYVLPEKWHKDWLELTAKLKKKKKVVDGYQFVEWASRLEYVLGDSGQPQPEFELGESFHPRDPEGRTWEMMAVALQVPVYVCAAPRHAERYVTLVNTAMMRDALSVRPPAGDDGAGKPKGDESTDGVVEEPTVKNSLDERIGEFRAFYAAHPDCTVLDLQHEFGLGYPAAMVLLKTLKEDTGVNASVPPAASTADEEHLRVWLRTWLGAIYEALVSNPTDAMTKGPWLPLYGFLAHLTTDVDAGALEAWRGISKKEEALSFMNEDVKNRAHLRLTLLFLLCAESDASDQPEKMIREVAAALGLDGKKLDKSVEAAAGK